MIALSKFLFTLSIFSGHYLIITLTINSAHIFDGIENEDDEIIQRGIFWFEQKMHNFF